MRSTQIAYPEAKTAMPPASRYTERNENACQTHPAVNPDSEAGIPA